MTEELPRVRAVVVVALLGVVVFGSLALALFVLLAGIFVAWMYADMGDPGVKGWTLALFVLVVTGGLSWFIVQL